MPTIVGGAILLKIEEAHVSCTLELTCHYLRCSCKIKLLVGVKSLWLTDSGNKDLYVRLMLH